MNELALVSLVVCGLCFGVSFMLTNRIYDYKEKKKAEKLRIGNIYVLGNGKNPFDQTKVVITDMKLGYVEYRFILDVMGKETVSSITESMQACRFANAYTEIASSGEHA